MKTTVFAGFLAAALAVPAVADRAQDDLQLIRKAVASPRTAEVLSPAEDPAQPAARSQSRKAEPQWFRVRIVEKAGKKAKVSVNLPLGLVRSLGDDWPIAEGRRCRKDHRCPTLGEILRALDTGQSLVEIDDEETTVRVWVE